MKVEILWNRYRQNLIITPVLPDGRYFPGEGLHIITDNPAKSIEELINQLQEHLNIIKNRSE